MSGKLQACFVFQHVTPRHVTSYRVYYNGRSRNVGRSTNRLAFTARSLPDGVFTGIVVFMVTAISRYGMGPTSTDTAIIHGKIHM